MGPIDLTTGFSVCILDDALLSVSAVGDVMEELGVYDGEINTGDPIPPGSHDHAYLIKQKMAE